MRKVLLFFLLFLLVSLNVSIAFSESIDQFKDFPDDWSYKALKNTVENNLLLGNNGYIRSSDFLTRAEFATVMNRLLGGEKQLNLKDFKDVKKEDWYYKSFSKAVFKKLFVGDENKLLKPNNYITREETFVVLARALKLGYEDDNVKDFEDHNNISSWAVKEISSLVGNGYIRGSENKILPKKYITRAEFAQLTYNIFKKYIQKPGVYSFEEKGNVIINSSDVTLKDSYIDGDLIIGDGVEDGDITLDSIEVTGRILARGGGENSIKIKGDSEIKNITIIRIGGTVRVLNDSGKSIGEVIADGTEDIILEGNFDNVYINSNNIKVNTINSKVKEIVVNGENSDIDFDKESKVDEMKVNSKNINITGKGKVNKVLANGENIIVKTKGTLVTAGNNSNNIDADGRKLSKGETVKTRENIRRSNRSSSSNNSSNEELEQVNTPVFNPTSSLVTTSSAIEITTTTTGASIYVTLDGSEPSNESSLYESPINITEDTTIKAIAIKNGMLDSEIVEESYQVYTGQVNTPVFSPTGGNVSSGTEVEVTTTTTGASIYVTLDGSEPSNESSLYESPINITEDTTIKAIAIKNGMLDSEIVEESYQVNQLFAGGTGTQVDPYQVETIDHLLNVNDYLDAHFIQIANIDLSTRFDSGEGWVPIRSGNNKFSGSYNGNDYYIRNLFINRPTDYYQGLFAFVSNTGEIKNLNLENVEINGDEYLGALAGVNDGTINNIDVTNLEIYCEDMYAGGLVGKNTGTITSCTTQGLLKADYSYIGGLVGYNYTSSDLAIISESSSDVNISPYNSDEQELETTGGLVGYNSNGTLQDSFATGTVEGHETIGGLVGDNGGTIDSCYSTGQVNSALDYSNDKGYYFGGLVGENYSDIISSYSESDVYGFEETGGLAGYSSGSIEQSYSLGRVEGISKVGGLVGSLNGLVNKSYSLSDVFKRGNDSYYGGLVGYARNSTITQSFSKGDVTGYNGTGGLAGSIQDSQLENVYSTSVVSGNDEIGGLVGYVSIGNEIINAYSTGGLTATSNSGGLVGNVTGSTPISTFTDTYYDQTITQKTDETYAKALTTNEMVDKANFEGFDFTNIWETDISQNTYPYFKWQNENYPIASTISRPELLGHWAFDSTPITSDSSTNNNDGNVNGATLTTDKDGENNKALYFDNAQVDLTNDIGLETLTLSAWIYLEDLDARKDIISGSFDLGMPSQCYSLRVDSSNNLIFESYPNGAFGPRKITSLNPLDLNQWFYVTGTYDGVNSKLYIDGELSNQDEFSFESKFWSTILLPTSIGAKPDSDYTYKGKIDEPRIYDGVLTKEEIQNLMNQ